MKLYFECLYCGQKWSEFVYSNNPSIRCGKCQETQLIKQHKADDGTYDVFGYGDAFKTAPEPEVKSAPASIYDDYLPGDSL